MPLWSTGDTVSSATGRQLLVPHQFTSMIGHNRSPNMFIGAGLSYGIVPLPPALLATKREVAEEHFGVQPCIDESKGNALYLWADAVLESSGASAMLLPKLELAKALGVIVDPEWAAEVGYPLKGIAARHRVIARFVREELWRGLWTWNWDCVLERALESVGFVRGESVAKQPWLTQYDSIVVPADFSKIGRRDLFCILKPHGCAEALLRAEIACRAGETELAAELSNRFMIGWKELDQARSSNADKLFFTEMKSGLASHPVMIAGWSVSEPYLLAVINDTLTLSSPKGMLEELSIVDIGFNQQGHQKTAACYGLSEGQVFFDVSTNGAFRGADHFFLWLQALYTVKAISDHIADDTTKLEFNSSAPLDPPNICEKTISWSDSFLPTWCRMCWRGGTVECAGFEVHQLNMDAGDEHIPLTIRGLPRNDLKGAAQIFLQYVKTSDWDVQTYPGAFWDRDQLRLVIPMPAWSSFNELAGLKPLIDQYDLGGIETMQILPVHFDPNQTIAESMTNSLRAKIAGIMSLPYFADVNNIGTIESLSA